MRIAAVISTLNPGGAERVMARLVNGLAGRGHDVSLLLLAQEGHPRFYPIDPAVQVSALGVLSDTGRILRPPTRLATGWRKLRTAFRSLTPDVVLAFGDVTNYLALLACRGLSIPVVVSERIDIARYRPPLARVKDLVRNATYPDAARIVLQTRRSAEAFFRYPPAHIAIIANPIDVTHVMARPEVAAADGRFRIIAVGRLDRQKGFDLLIPAFASIADRFPAWAVAIYGEGPERGRLQKAIDACGLAGRMTLPGLSREIASELARAHLMAFPSRYEGFPNALAEAMAVGLPSVAFADVSGVEELILPGRTGIAVDMASGPPGLARALAELMRDGRRRAELGAAARVHVTRWSTRSVVGDWEALLGQVAAERVPIISGR